jgi:formiminotetrahydrofolate cyclodeaminase
MSRSAATSRTIADYADAIASAEPAPGGGSVVATTAAFAAGLGEMVVRLTLARAKDAIAVVQLEHALPSLTRLRHRLLDLATEDERAYAAYREALALPKDTPEAQAARHAAIERALEASAQVPIAVAQACADLLETLVTVARHGTKHALTDVATAAYLAEAALRGAALFVTANASLMRAHERANELARAAAQIREQGKVALAACLEAIEQRQPALATR